MPTQADTPAASLVGALGVFALADVLRLIADGAHSGEVLVVANGLDGRLWLQDGALTGAAVRGTNTLAQAVFELALLEEGWFYFTAGRAAPEPVAPQGVSEVLDVVLPQVVEWRDLLHRVPLDATVTVSPTPPQAQVQLSAVEWQVLAAVGGRGARVIDVVAATGRDQVQTVRTLRDMADAGLVTISPTATTPAGARGGAAAPVGAPPPVGAAAPVGAAHRPPPPVGHMVRRDPPASVPTAAPAPPATMTGPVPVPLPATAPAPPPVAAVPADAALVPIAMAGDRTPTDRASDRTTGDSRVGDGRTGESRTGDSRVGDSRTGDSRAGDSRTGDGPPAESRASERGGGERVPSGRGVASDPPLPPLPPESELTSPHAPVPDERSQAADLDVAGAGA